MTIEIADNVTFPRRRPGESWVVGALITDPDGRVFLQRRSHDRQLFPGCWDIVGGHVEQDESLLAALQREVFEETGWHLHRVHAVAARFDWKGADGESRQEFDVVATVCGDLSSPRLEWTKHSDYRWVGRDDLHLLAQNRQKDDTVIHDIVANHFASHADG